VWTTNILDFAHIADSFYRSSLLLVSPTKKKQQIPPNTNTKKNTRQTIADLSLFASPRVLQSVLEPIKQKGKIPNRTTRTTTTKAAGMVLEQP
jgi:hypothetical protein